MFSMLLIIAIRAPAPFPRFISAKDLVGTWSLQWDAKKGKIEFTADGKFNFDLPQFTGTGKWTVKNNVLTIDSFSYLIGDGEWNNNISLEPDWNFRLMKNMRGYKGKSFGRKGFTIVLEGKR